MLNKSVSIWKNESDIEKLTHLAINAATEADWNEAAKINKKIVSLSENNVEALNRLARAQACTGQLVQAQKTYKKVMQVDPYNSIAQKNIEKISKITKTNSNNNGYSNGQTQVDLSFSSHLVYEPGKTKIISLLNLATPGILATLNCGEKLSMNLKKHGICITTDDGQYLGALPDDLAHRLLAYISGGNKYSVFVKYATTKNLTIFIKEVARSAKFANQPSFQTNSKN